ncbi:MAG: hypothetical protein Q8P05_03730 [Candidatus Diapherotrites archaeon]|nr:hypothetical protein [Candidatus Diapherotrites archaeon]
MKPNRVSNQRGFTLFTALLAAILILLAGLLINTMINAERTSNEVVLEIEAQSRMQTLADLTRADALQVVNYGIRNAIEEYTQTPDNPYLYSAQSQQWKDVIGHFSTFYFGGNNGSIIAGRIAANLYQIILTKERSIGGYTLTIQGGQEPEIKQAIESVLNQTAGAQKDYLQVIQCDETTPPVECVGTFYVNLDFSLISDDEYEKLPAIHVRDPSSGRVIVSPVIPRGQFRIYVPLRIFRALKYSHELAQGQLVGGGGLLSPQFHAQLNNLGVGMCDSGACGYRSQPFTPGLAQIGPGAQPPPGAQGGNLCPAEQSGLTLFEDYYPQNVPLTCDAPAASLNLCQSINANITHYDPAVGPSRAAALSTLTRGIIGNQVQINLTQLAQTPDFRLLTNNITVVSQPVGVPSKTITFEGLENAPSFGVEAHCTKLSTINVTLRFEDTNTQYAVVDHRSPLRYEVRILDSFAANAQVERCTSYCLTTIRDYAGLFVTGDIVSAGACPETACALPDTYHPPPVVCGNNSLDPSDPCDYVNNVPLFTQYGDGVNQCVVYGQTQGTPFTGGDLRCYPANSAQECTIDVSACE